jgi:hypothetical protein
MLRMSHVAAAANTEQVMIDRTDTDGSYALLILPTLRRIRAARGCPDALAGGTASAELVACAELAHTTIVALDRRLRAAGLYDLAQPDLLENDAQRMAAACRLIDETRRQLCELAHSIHQRAAQSGAGTDAALAELVATLDEGA